MFKFDSPAAERHLSIARRFNAGKNLSSRFPSRGATVESRFRYKEYKCSATYRDRSSSSSLNRRSATIANSRASPGVETPG